MARIAKSKDTANYRKGKDLQVGDQVAVRWDGMKSVEFSAIVSINAVDAATVGQSGGRQYRAELADGTAKVATGAEFVEGRY